VSPTTDRRPVRARGLLVEDVALVRAPVGLVYATLTDVERWPTWWPGIAVAPGDGPERWRLRFGRRPLAVVLAAEASGWRHDVGFRLALGGALEGESEWWLEPDRGGTVVHHVLRVEDGRVRRAERRVARLRQAVRRGQWGLQDRLELAVRLALGFTADARAAPARR